MPVVSGAGLGFWTCPRRRQADGADTNNASLISRRSTLYRIVVVGLLPRRPDGAFSCTDTGKTGRRLPLVLLSPTEADRSGNDSSTLAAKRGGHGGSVDPNQCHSGNARCCIQAGVCHSHDGQQRRFAGKYCQRRPNPRLMRRRTLPAAPWRPMEALVRRLYQWSTTQCVGKCLRPESRSSDAATALEPTDATWGL